MTFEQTRLTTLEETKALIYAGISPDMDTWDDATLEAASVALDAAQAAKVARLTVRHTPKADAYTLADMTSDLEHYLEVTK